jgi:3-oxoacyl-[acyl-carrier protein] reductase
MTMNINLKGKKAVVCGSTSGIGKAIAFELADLGAELILIARDEDKLEKIVKELNNKNSREHKYLAVDFSDPEDLKNKLRKNFNQYSPVHILVNNTGGPPAGKAIEAGADNFIDAFKMHLICNQIFVKAFVEGMKKEKYGRIINIISTSVKQPIPNLGISNTIRGAVASWSKTLAGELGQFGITVNNILPGATETDRLYSLIKNKAEKSRKSEEDVRAEMISEIPAGRFAIPEELAYLAGFLASPVAAYINGVSIAVDGGRTVCL